MPRTVVRDGQFAGFAGGLNRTADPFALANNQIRVAENVRVSRFGGLIKRDGSYLYPAGSPPTTATAPSGFTCHPAAGVSYAIMANNGVTYTTDLQTQGTWVNEGLALSASVSASYAQFLDGTGAETVYIADGGLLNKWVIGTGTPTANIASTPSCTVLKVHNQRLWGIGDSTAPDSLFYSALNNGDTLGIGASGGGQIIVRTFGDSKILALASHRESLYIFHDRGISRLTGFGQDDTTVTPEGVSGTEGVLSVRSIVETDEGVYFVTTQGVFVANDSGVQRLGTTERPDPVFEYLQSSSAGGLDALTIIAALSPRTAEIMFAIYGHGTYVLNLTTRTWTGVWTGPWALLLDMFECEEPAAVSGFNGRAVLMGVVDAGSSTTAIHMLDVPNYVRDGSTYASVATGSLFSLKVTFRRADFGDVTTSKSMRWGFFTGYFPASSDIIVSWDMDAVSGQSTLTTPAGGVWDTARTWDATQFWGPAGYRQYRIPMHRNGYFADVSILDGNAFRTEISRFVMDAYTLGIR
jgi:hypothetical protein